MIQITLRIKICEIFIFCKLSTEKILSRSVHTFSVNLLTSLEKKLNGSHILFGSCFYHVGHVRKASNMLKLF